MPEIAAISSGADIKRPSRIYQLIFATTLAGLAFAGDTAGRWEPAGPFGGSVQSVAADPQHPAILLAGARNGLLFRSLDGAKSWRRIPFPRALSGSVRALAIDPANSRHYYAGISGEDPLSSGLWESADEGEHWQRALAGLSVESLALWRKDANLVVAGTRRGVYRFEKGKEWARISSPQNPELQDVTAIAFDPADASTIYAGTPHLPWKTTDGGVSWQSIRGGMIDDSDVFSIAIDPGQPTRVFASACSGIYRSEDAGGVWKLLNGVPKTSRRTHIIAPDPRRAQVLYAGTTAGLLKSEDGGAVWRQLNSLQVNSVAFDPMDSRTLYLATETSGVLITHDGGQTLLPANEGIHTRNVGSLTIAGDAAWVSTAYEGDQGGVFKFEPASGWRQMSSPAVFDGNNVRALTAEPGGQFVYATTGDRLYRASYLAKNGEKWTLVGTTGLPDIRALAFTAEGKLLAGTSRGLFWSKEGSTWQATDIAGHARLPVQAIYTAGDAVAIRTDFGLYVSRDGGGSWKEWVMPPGAERANEIALSCDGAALVATPGGLLRASPAGAPPSKVRGIPAGTVSAVTFDPAHCGTAYAAQFGATYISRDEGSTWELLAGAGTHTGLIEAMRVLPSSPARLFATFRTEGTFTLDLR